MVARTVRSFAALVAAWALAGCAETALVDTGSPVVETLTISEAAVALSSLGETVQLVATARDLSGAVVADATVTWTSDRPDIAAVDPTGLVTALSSGAATIIGTSGAVDAEVTVVVAQAVDAVMIASGSLSLSNPGASESLSASVTDAGGSEIEGAALDWASRDEAVAAVDGSGMVTAVAEGATRIVASSGTASDSVTVTVDSDAPPTDTSDPVPLTGMADVTYRGFEGGLYPGGVNEIPADHLQAGLAASAAIEPLDTAGQPDPGGSYVLLSIGMSNTTEEFCSESSTYPCTDWSFVGQAMADPDVADQGLVFVNGASAGQIAAGWTSPTSFSFNRVLTEDLQPMGLSELQVQAVWLKVANPLPNVSLPDADADAIQLQRFEGEILRALRVRYPNLRLVFLSSRIYAGYATDNLNPEPYAYESGFSAKWTIEAQIEQESSGLVDPTSGDLEIGQAAPWVGWGPYIWADGPIANSDGLTWLPGDFDGDGTHPNASGTQKVGAALLEFFKGSSITAGWFLR